MVPGEGRKASRYAVAALVLLLTPVLQKLEEGGGWFVARHCVVVFLVEGKGVLLRQVSSTARKHFWY